MPAHTEEQEFLPAVTFDLWHTLILLAPAAEDRYIESQESILEEIVRSSPRLRHRAPGRVVDPAQAARLAFSAAIGQKGRGSAVGNLAVDAAYRAGREADPTRWVRALDALVDEQPFQAVPGARDQLRRLTDEGYRTAVVSNLVGETGGSMRRVMERLDLAQFIESWAFSDELPWAKPAPEIFWRALEPLATSPSEAVHIGDLGIDVHGARAAGFRCSVLFLGARAYGPRYASLCRAGDPIHPPPDRVLSSWNELPSLLDSVFDERVAGPHLALQGRG
jgi:HAD superfamily hydrolase (TIGR01549 family)